jgi:hypothetical protein
MRSLSNIKRRLRELSALRTKRLLVDQQLFPQTRLLLRGRQLPVMLRGIQ